MPKPITVEMLQAMSLDQRKILQRNALGLGTPAAQAVLLLLSQGDLMERPKPAASAATTRRKAAPKKAKSTAEVETKPVKAVYGRRT